MHIGINALTDFSGGAIIHLENLLKYWGRSDRQHKYSIFTTYKNYHKLPKFRTDNSQYRLFRIPGVSLITKLIWEQIIFPFYLKKACIDILFCPFNFGPILSPFKTVLMIQNIAPFFENVVENEKTRCRKIKYKVLAFLMKMAAKKADVVIFPSRYGQKLIVNNFNISEEKTVVIYHGKDNSFSPIKDTKQIIEMKQKMGIKDNFIFCVAHIYRYKNLKELLKAFVKVKNTVDNYIQLLIAGKIYDQQYMSELSSIIKKYELEDTVIIKEVRWQDLPYLYSSCHFFISPSTCEIFSQVLVEAMSCGAPILCANLTAIPEICKDAALYFDPYNIDDIADKMLLILKNKQMRSKLADKALKRSQQFPSWEEVAERTLSIIELAAK